MIHDWLLLRLFYIFVHYVYCIYLKTILLSQLFIIFEELYSLCLMLYKDDLRVVNSTKRAVMPTA